MTTPKVVPLPYPHRKKKDTTEERYQKFLTMLANLQVSLPFTEIISEMPTYARYLKEILAKKRVISDSPAELKTLSIPEQVSADAPISTTQGHFDAKKLDDPGRLTITVRLGKHKFEALCDTGASTSLLPFAI